MHIVLTGSIGNIGKPLTQQLVQKGHAVTVISSTHERAQAIEAMGAKAAIGSMFDAGFLAKTFEGADIVYLMETMEAAGDMFDTSVDFIASINQIGENYKTAVEQAGIKKVVHLSSIGAHTHEGTGILVFHYNVERILGQLSNEVAIKFIRPASIYFNLYASIDRIKTTGAMVSNYAGDQKEPWVSPLDIADVIAAEMDLPFAGRTVRYVASDEVSPNEIAAILGAAIGKPGLKWEVLPDETLLNAWLGIGFNEQIARGFVAFQASQRSGVFYEDYNRHRPVLGKVKFTDFAKEFARVYNQQ